jgi:AraC-like DNA-binding protein
MTAIDADTVPAEVAATCKSTGASLGFLATGQGSGTPWAIGLSVPPFRTKSERGRLCHLLCFYETGPTSVYKAIGRRVCGLRMVHRTCCFVPHDEVAEWAIAGASSSICIYIDPVALSSYAEESGFGRNASIDPFFGLHDPWLTAFFDMLHAETLLYDQRLVRLDSLLLSQSNVLLFDRLLRWHSSSTRNVNDAARTSSPLNSRTLARILEFIESTLWKRIDLGDMASVANLSERHLIRAFRAETGKTPYRFVLDRRLEFAATELRRSSKLIREVSAMCGFSSAAHFTAAFRAQFGVAPGEYRRLVTRTQAPPRRSARTSHCS